MGLLTLFCVCIYVEFRGQPAGVGSVLPPDGFHLYLGCHLAGPCCQRPRETVAVNTKLSRGNRKRCHLSSRV